LNSEFVFFEPNATTHATGHSPMNAISVDINGSISPLHHAPVHATPQFLFQRLDSQKCEEKVTRKTKMNTVLVFLS
jgi:hypothetical protein